MSIESSCDAKLLCIYRALLYPEVAVVAPYDIIGAIGNFSLSAVCNTDTYLYIMHIFIGYSIHLFDNL